MSSIAPSQQSTARLLDEARAGSARAVEQLLGPLRPLVEGYLKKRTRTPQDAEDLSQNVLLRASRNLANFRGECPISQWALRIAANELRNYYERILPGRNRTASLDEMEEIFAFELQQPDPEPGPSEQMESGELAVRILRAAKAACNAQEFMVLSMFYQGEELAEIADLLEMNSATIRSHFLRGRGKLLAHLFSSDPDLLGGEDAIAEAMARAQGAQDAADRLEEREAEALRNPKGNSEIHRAACLKLARHLAVPMGILLMIVGVCNGTI